MMPNASTNLRDAMKSEKRVISSTLRSRASPESKFGTIVSRILRVMHTHRLKVSAILVICIVAGALVYAARQSGNGVLQVMKRVFRALTESDMVERNEDLKVQIKRVVSENEELKASIKDLQTQLNSYESLSEAVKVVTSLSTFSGLMFALKRAGDRHMDVLRKQAGLGS